MGGVGTLLASGSRDTAVIVWDVITESGLFRLKGHKDSVTGLRFIEQQGGTDYVSGAGTTGCGCWVLMGHSASLGGDSAYANNAG